MCFVMWVEEGERAAGYSPTGGPNRDVRMRSNRRAKKQPFAQPCRKSMIGYSFGNPSGSTLAAVFPPFL
jgi:hypothetical protein